MNRVSSLGAPWRWDNLRNLYHQGHKVTRRKSRRLRGIVLVLLILSSGMTNAISIQSRSARDPRKLFETGEAALHAGKLDEAERAFRQVLAIHPGGAGAYANLGVVDM